VKIVIHASEYPPGPGGIGVHAWSLARGLHARGFGVHVIAPQPGADGAEVEAFNRGEPYRVTTVPAVGPAWLDGLGRTRRLAAAGLAARAEAEPVVVVASGQRPLWVAATAAGPCAVPWLAVAHGTELDSRVRWQRALTGWSLRRADLVVGVSRFTCGFLPRYEVDPARVHTIPNGADPEAFSPRPADNPTVASLRQRLRLGAGPVLVTVGNLTERKGQDVVIRALPALLDEWPDLVYVAVGLPTRKEELQRLADGLGVGHAVRFAGRLPQQELAAACSLADLFVMTSRHTKDGDFEGFGIAVVEAALCGTPAVVSGDSGLEEAVADGVTGVVVPQDDPEATAAAILRLLGDRSALESMGVRALERARREQTWDRRVSEYAALLELLAQNPRRHVS